MTLYSNVLDEIKSFANIERAEHSMRFFKTGKGEYGEGDLFLGLSTPEVKALAKKYYKIMELSEIEKLLQNEYHDVRVAALSMLVHRFEKGIDKKAIVDLYLKNTKYINNWDLVDISCYKIIGRHTFENKDYSILDELACTGHLWSERIAVVSNLYLVKHGEFSKIKEFAVKFLGHKHDLMHKAVGWVLREMGKEDESELCTFLDKYSKKLPRTALRYSLEKFTPERRKHYMAK